MQPYETMSQETKAALLPSYTTFFCSSSIYDENPMLRSHSLM